MASKVEYKRKTATKRDRSKSRGTARRRKVTVRSSGRGPRAARDSMGRYSSDGGVDEHTKEELMKLIEKM